MDNNTKIFFATLGAFLAWLALVFAYLVPTVIRSPETINPMMSLLTALGIGAVTQFFIAMLTIEIYFFFRKKPPTETTPTPK